MAMNMDAVLRIVAKVDGGNALQKLGADLAGVGKSAGASVSPFGQMRGALRGVADVAATIGLATVGRTLLNAGIEAEQSSIRINALAKQYGEVADVTDVAARAAEQFALGNVEAQNAVTNLYGRLRPMGVSLQDIETVFFGVNKAAKQVGLSTYDTSEVLLQLSQALGSGKLQGDELRSIMERMPAVGQAVAKVMGVSASEIKKLGSEGKITTEVMIQAAAELNKIVPPPPTAMQEFDKALKDLRTELGENLLPILVPFVRGITSLVTAFAQLPEPIQTTALALVAFAVAAGPVASVITGIGQAMMIIGSLNIGATIAGWAGAVVPAIVAIKAAFLGLLGWFTATLLPGLIAFFSGPVGWTVLAIAAVVAMAIAFREPLTQFVSWLWKWTEFAREPFVRLWDAVVGIVTASLNTLTGAIKAWGNEIRKIWSGDFSTLQGIVDTWRDAVVGIWTAMGEAFKTYLVEPIRNAWSTLTEFLPRAMQSVATFVSGIWNGMITGIQNAVRGMLTFVVNAVNRVGGLVNVLIDAFNRLAVAVGRSPIGRVPILPVPAFAEGGIVDRPTLALVGERREREYIIPESKMQAASSRFLGGARGGSVIPSSGSTSTPTRATTPQINVTTGPVMQQQDGSRWVSMDDFERGLQQVAEQVVGTLRTPQARTALGWS
jgi:tape measure domain-containing protein